MKYLNTGICLAVATWITSCNSEQAGFNGTVKNPQPRVATASDAAEPKSGDRVIEVTCSDSPGENKIEVNHNGSTQDLFQVKAAWCLKGKQVGRLKLMFLVDLSGSMRKNDPLVNGSCGRLEGARALVSQIRNAKKETDIVEVATVTFGSDARPVSDFVALDDFSETKMTADIFCAAVDQTNYQGALDTAADIIQTSGDTQTPVVAYLLSDGLPSLGTEKSQEDYAKTEQAALLSAKSLLALGNVSLNAVYLQAEKPAGATAPESYLAALTGGADKVKIVSNAKDLGGSITTFDLPAAKTSTASATATITGAGAARRLELKSVEPDEADPNKILVITKRFQLEEDDRTATTRYTIKLKVDANDGTEYKTTIVINLNNR